MTEFKNATCPNCGSPLDFKPGDTRIKCAYCGSSILVSEHEDSTPEAPQYQFKMDEQVAREIGTAGKVVAGITIGSFIVPIIITVVVLCGVGVLLYFVFGNVHSAVNNLTNSPTEAAITFPSPAPTDTAAPTAPPPTVEPTNTLFPTPLPFADVLFRDNFTNTSSGWDQSHDTNYILEYKNGAYHVTVGAQNGGQSVWIGSSYTNVSVEVDATQNAGPDDAMVGVSCRYKDNVGGYSFEYARNGTYGIYKYVQGNPDSLDEETLSPNTVNASGINHIEGICAGPTLTLVLNGVALMQVQDSDYTSGGAGLIVRTGDSGTAGIDVLFKNFLVKGP
ncbi:MAG: hypothetical protein WCE68_08775 [Anaerolineales bacterium]